MDNSIKAVFGTVFVALFLFVGLSIMGGSCWYKSDMFTAKVVTIDYYGEGGIWGSSKATVKLDDGRVYSLYEIPSDLREGGIYELDYRTPSLLGDPSLVIVSE